MYRISFDDTGKDDFVLNWTTDPPAEPGLYWYTYKFKGQWQKPSERRLTMFDGDLCEETCGDDGGEYEPVKYFLCSGEGWMILGPPPELEQPE